MKVFFGFTFLVLFMNSSYGCYYEGKSYPHGTMIGGIVCSHDGWKEADVKYLKLNVTGIENSKPEGKNLVEMTLPKIKKVRTKDGIVYKEYCDHNDRDGSVAAYLGENPDEDLDAYKREVKFYPNRLDNDTICVTMRASKAFGFIEPKILIGSVSLDEVRKEGNKTYTFMERSDHRKKDQKRTSLIIEASYYHRPGVSVSY